MTRAAKLLGVAGVLSAGLLGASWRARADENDLQLTVSVSIGGKGHKELKPIALSETSPPPLTADEQAAAHKAVARLFRACARDEEAPTLLVGIAPARESALGAAGLKCEW